MLERIASVVTQVMHAGKSVVGIRTGTEEPHFDLQQQLNGVEIRCYDARIAAQTTVGGAEQYVRSQGFRRLAGYIFGGNNANAKIAMTAPVGQERGPTFGVPHIAMTAPVAEEPGRDGTWVIRFFMPAKWTLETLPAPRDESVQLVTVPAATFAVLCFTGDRGPAAVAVHTDELLRALHDTEFTPVGPPQAWFYDPPWTLPFRRRNEVAVPVSRR